MPAKKAVAAPKAKAAPKKAVPKAKAKAAPKATPKAKAKTTKPGGGGGANGKKPTKPKGRRGFSCAEYARCFCLRTKAQGGEQRLKALLANSKGISLRLLIIDTEVDPGDVLARSVLKTVHVVRFDSKTTTYDELIDMVYEAHKQNKAPFRSICFANHGPVVDPAAPGYNQWPIAADKVLDLRSVNQALDDFAPFLSTLTAALQKTGMDVRHTQGLGASHVDFLACNLASACKGFIPALERMYGQDFRGSTDETGNILNGGNWKMETDNDYDAALDYIDWDNLAEYSETMGWFSKKQEPTKSDLESWLEEERWTQLRNYKPEETINKLEAGTCAKADLDYNRGEVYSSSFAHPAMEKIIKAQRANEDDPDVDGVEVLSQDHVFRVYPDSINKRMTNRNYNPFPFWRAGCQIVALNMQMYDEVIWVNAGKFRANHGIGYVPKPKVEGYLPPLTKRCKIGINVRVDDLPDGESVIMSVHGQVKNCVKGSNRASFSEEQLCWEDQLATPQVAAKGPLAGRKEWVLTDPEHAVVLIVVRDAKSQQLKGQFAFPASEIKGGACSVILLDDKGLVTSASRRLRLFVDHEDLNNTNGTTAVPSAEAVLDTKYPAGRQPFKPPTQTPHTSAGLASYWINSSHNSYLPGGTFSNQITSMPSAEMLTQLVKTGCRVIELDCYNTGTDDVSVYHDKTPTRGLDFRKCIEAMKAGIDDEKVSRHDTNKKQGPLIITLENHATGKNYSKMGITMRTVFGDLLHLPGDDMSGARALKEIGHLCDKVIVRGKPRDNKCQREVSSDASFETEN